MEMTAIVYCCAVYNAVQGVSTNRVLRENYKVKP